MIEIGGAAARGFEPVRDAFAKAQGDDAGGAQLCVMRGREVVVDLWTGRDPTNNRAYDANTLTVLMSCTKAAVALCCHMLAERGALDLAAPIARYWPEFAAQEKDRITTAHVLSHSAGLIGFAPGDHIEVSDLLNWDRCVAALARMPALWPPGTAFLYHPVTYGFLLGEVIRRVSGKSVGEFFADEIADPLKLDLWIGLPAREEYRVAPHLRPAPAGGAAQWRSLLAPLGVDFESPLISTLIEAFVTTDALIDAMNERPARAAQILAGNGIGSARALAKMYAAAIGEIDGVRLLSPESLACARAPQTDLLCAPPPFPQARGGSQQRFALGFELPRSIMPMLGHTSFGHPGAGGRVAYGDPETGYAVAYVCNNMLWDGFNPDPRWSWNAALRDVVEGERAIGAKKGASGS